MVPSQSWGYFKDLEGAIGFDLDRAKALLKEAGYEKGFACEIMSSSNKSYDLGELAQILQADLKKIGVNATVTELESARYDTRMNKGDIQMMVHNYAWANRDPGTLVHAAKAWYTDKEGGWCHFESAEYEQLRRDLQSTMDLEKRKAIFRKLQELVLDECFTIPVARQPMAFVVASHVKNFRHSIMNAPFAGDIWLDK
jgi:peptide/nickel transport system substrate-binding protein